MPRGSKRETEGDWMLRTTSVAVVTPDWFGQSARGSRKGRAFSQTSLGNSLESSGFSASLGTHIRQGDDPRAVSRPQGLGKRVG